MHSEGLHIALVSNNSTGIQSVEDKMNTTTSAAAAASTTTNIASPVCHIRQLSKPIWKTHGARIPFVPPVTSVGSMSASANATSSSTFEIVPLPSIDTAQFDEEVTVVALRVPIKRCGILVGHLKSLKSESLWLYSRARISAIIPSPDHPDEKLILLREDFTNIEQFNQQLPEVTRTLIQTEGVIPCLFTFRLTYEYFPLDYVLPRLLPSNMPIPSGFETIGHIAHLNLSEEQRPYGPIIARVLLDKSPHLHTVVNKVGSIETQFAYLQWKY